MDVAPPAHEKPRHGGAARGRSKLEAEVGIEPAYADLQSGQEWRRYAVSTCFALRNV
jgi:hypothetical protein